VFYTKYLELCAREGLSPSAAAIEIGLKKPTVTNWKKGGNPTDATRRKVAEFFGVPLSFFNEDQEEEYDEFLELLKSDPDSRAILKSYGSSNKEDRQRITRMVKALKGKEDE
jgi:transcriptional regulator with XRE-family HTH domain